MKNILFLSLSILSIFALIYSCSSETEDTSPPPALVQQEESEPDPIQYTLTITALDGGTVSTEGGTYDAGTDITITATSDPGYEFDSWSNGSIENPIKISVSEDLNIVANFKKVTFAFFENLTDLNKNTSWFQTNINFNKLYLHNSFFNCYTEENGVTDQCAGGNYSGYSRETGGYLYYDFNDDGDLDLWHHFLAHPWPKDKRGIDSYFVSYSGNNKAYDSIYPSLTQVRKHVLSDFDNDGLNEIMLFSSGLDAPPFPGDSLAIFIPSKREYKFLSESINYFHGGATGDINQDGLIDIYSSADNLEPTLYINKGDYIFELTDLPFKNFPNALVNLSSGNDTFTDELFDINLDERLDIISGKLLFLQNSEGEFDYSEKILLPINSDNLYSQQTPLDYDFLDINNDGLVDIIVTSEIDFYQGSRIDILIQTSQNIFENRTTEFIDIYEFKGPNAWWKWLYVLDFDNDGDLDLVADGLFGELFNYDHDLLWWENNERKFENHQVNDYY